MLGFAVTIFISAFLLFQVQPLIGKYILPWFGGGPAVWTSCMLFFQMLLLGGYAYAHVIRTRLSQRTQVIVHVTLLAAALLALPIAPSEGWKPQGDENPALYILLLLAVTVGLPYFVLSATGPLLQAWFSVRHPGRSPYRLYALSNVGSLLALLSYPFLVEPAMALRSQSTTWSIGFGVFVAFCIVSALSMLRVRPTDADEAGADEDSAPPGWGVRLVWVALAACGSTMLLAVTNQMSWDVAVVPFLWVLPLTLYLLTFIICFEFERWYYRPVFWPLLGLGAGAIVHLMFEGVRMPILFQVAGYAGGMFFCCMVCHGELVRLKPSPRYLTSFYLMVSAGGALGGLFVSLVAPAVFPMYLELHIGLWMTCALALVVYLYSRGLLSFWRWPVKEIARGGAWAVGASAVVVYTVLLVYAVWEHGSCGAMEPYLSLMPLILYTAVFALQLGRERWYVHPVVQVIVVAGAGGMLWHMIDVGKPGIGFQAAAHAAGMVAWYGVFHRDLTSLAPDRADLRWFYLVVTVGAGIGGGLMALAAPAGLAQYLWVHIALWGACTAALAVYARTRGGLRVRRLGGHGVAWAVAYGLGLAVLAVSLVWQVRDSYSDVLSLSRSFYGVLSVRSSYKKVGDTEWLYYKLQHGRINHGCQFAAKEKRLMPITYYGEKSGVGLAVRHLRPDGAPLRIGVVGLGTGTIAGYGRADDVVRFYEINHDVLRLATSRFTYLTETPAKTEVKMGDARISMEREDSQQFDVLAIDAFSSDAIPAHLLTRESFETYLRHMKSDGVIAVHISNRYLDLRPVVLGIAVHFGLEIAVIDSDAEEGNLVNSCTWILVTRNAAFLAQDEVASEIDPEELEDVVPLLWTDDYSNLYEILK